MPKPRTATQEDLGTLLEMNPLAAAQFEMVTLRRLLREAEAEIEELEKQIEELKGGAKKPQ